MHTPGPWTDEEGMQTGRVVVAVGQPKVRRSVAACGGPNREGNARLIAAAPDMLEALNAVVATSPIEDSVLPMVLAAIAKATGAA